MTNTFTTDLDRIAKVRADLDKAATSGKLKPFPTIAIFDEIAYHTNALITNGFTTGIVTAWAADYFENTGFIVMKTPCGWNITTSYEQPSPENPDTDEPESDQLIFDNID